MKITRNFYVLWGNAAVLTFIYVSLVFGQPKPGLSDAEVASGAVIANQIDISYAGIAKEKSKDAAVLRFAPRL